MWYVYFLELSNQDIYVGYTRDLRQRFSTHNAGKVQATKSFLPAKLKSYVSVDHRSTALGLEKAFAFKRFLRKI